jgi:hypothetical protein
MLEELTEKHNSSEDEKRREDYDSIEKLSTLEGREEEEEDREDPEDAMPQV